MQNIYLREILFGMMGHLSLWNFILFPDPFLPIIHVYIRIMLIFTPPIAWLKWKSFAKRNQTVSIFYRQWIIVNLLSKIYLKNSTSWWERLWWGRDVLSNLYDAFSCKTRESKFYFIRITQDFAKNVFDLLLISKRL